MIEDSNGNYQQSTDNNFPGYEYFYNQTKSGCMSSSGKQIEDSLLYDQDKKKATVKVSETSMCYLYFDKYKSTTFADQLIDSGNLWQSGLEGDGYRYTGSGTVGTSTNPNNFICFGTTDKSACTTNQDKYMYRVLGVFSDSNGENHVKLIKYKQLGSTYKWNADDQIDISWKNSDMYKELNGNNFLTNTTYDYLQNTEWSNKIENWTWSAVNTQTGSNGGPSYYNKLKPIEIYLHEMNRSTKTSTVGEWTNPTAKIGLMYVSDYVLSLGDGALTISGNAFSIANALKTGWMHQGNNDSSIDTNEWTMALYGINSSNFSQAWAILASGFVNKNYLTFVYAARPVFYLTSNQAYLGGNGSLDDPFMIDTSSGNVKLAVSTSATGSTLTAKITKGMGNLNKYCINNKASINDCEWKNITSTTITYNMTEYGTYYVHVIDDTGYIAHSSYTYDYVEVTPLTEHLITNENLWQSNLEEDGYRYTGSGTVGTSTNPNNFICFGTTDKSTCTANQDKYMYRVLGVFSDAYGDNHVKLIKYKQLGSYKWNTTSADVNWTKSTLFSSLNGSSYLTSTTYFPSDEWTNKVENWSWSAVNTQTYSSSGPDYRDVISPKQIYLHEMNRNTKTSTVGSWDTSSGKIGLMYASDYLLSLGSSVLSITSGTVTNGSSLLKGWLHPSNNDTTKSSNEWLMPRLGPNNTSSAYGAWYLFKDGYVVYVNVTNSLGVRPVFYLTSDVGYSSGTGTLEDPIMLN